MVDLIPSLNEALPVRFLCWNEPNFTRPIAVANSGWSSADFKPLMDQVAASMMETEKTMNELQFATGLAPLDEEIPELVQPPVQLVR